MEKEKYDYILEDLENDKMYSEHCNKITMAIVAVANELAKLNSKLDKMTTITGYLKVQRK